MEGLLSFDNIATGVDVESLFTENASTEDTEATPPQPTEVGKTGEDELIIPIKPQIIESTEEDDFFSDEKKEEPESVGSAEDKQGKEDTAEKQGGTSPNNFYSSIAKALKEDGVLPDLDDETVDSPEAFAEAIEKAVEGRLDETTKRLKDALDSGLEPEEVRQYESTINYLNGITEKQLIAEDNAGSKLRYQLIYRDKLNRDYSQERAKRETDKSFTAGTDVEDAKDALADNKTYFNKAYKQAVEEGLAAQHAAVESRKKEAADFKKQVLEEKEIFDGIKLDTKTKQKVYDTLNKPISKTEDGRYLNAIQKAEMDNPIDFRKRLAYIFTMTDGFKNIDKLSSPLVKKAERGKIQELQHTLTNTSRGINGDLRFASGVDDMESKVTNFEIDI